MIPRRLLFPVAVGSAAGIAAAWATRRARGAAPARVVSVGGAVTESVYALGQGARLVAADSTSLYPAPAAALPRIGYMRALLTEGLIALAPDLVLLSDQAGPPQAVAMLRAAGLPLAVVPDGAGPGAAEGKVRAVAAALDVDGEALAAAVAADWRALDAPVAALAEPWPRAVFVLSLARGAPLVSGRGTHADAMLHTAGAENAVAAFDGYRPLSSDAAAVLAPDAVVMVEHALAEAGGAAAAFAAPALAVTPAAAAGRMVALEGSYALNFGPRAAHVRRDLARLLHPGAAFPDLPERPWTAPG